MARNFCWLLLGLGFPGMLGCGRGQARTAVEPASTAAEVVVVQPVRESVSYTVEQPGRIEPFEQTPIHAKIAGYVRSVHVEIGDRVKRGDLLAELDVPELVEEHRRKESLSELARQGVRQAEQAERVAGASIRSAEAGIDVARASLAKAQAALDRWQSEHQRMEQLVKQGVMDRQNRDEVRNQFRAATAAQTEAEARIRAAEAVLAEVQARRDKTRIDREAARSQQAVAEADERQTRALLGYTRLIAPFDGVVADRRVHTGHFLQAAPGGTKGEPLFVVVRIDKVRVFLEVPEADAVQIKASSPGRIRVQSLNDREFVGQVAGTSWSLDHLQRTLRTEIDFDNPDGLLRPGMYIHALVDVDRPDAWLIPAAAVLARDGESFCYEVRDGRARRLPVRLGLRIGERVEVRKFQSPPRRPGDRPGWSDPTGKEVIVAARPGEYTDGQPVRQGACCQ